MPKAVLSNRIFLETDIDTAEKIRKELTYTIPSFSPNGTPLIIRNYARVTDKIITIPIGRLDLIPEGYEIIDRRKLVPAQFPDFNGQLRPSQQAIWDVIEDNAIINAWVSFGKTFTALAIAAKLEQKTLVVTHTLPLRNQWVREVEKAFGFTPGTVGSGKFNIDTPIVVGNVQTLYNRMDVLYDKFGLVILDECLDYNTRITTKDGPKTIGSIVNNQIYTDVLSYNKDSGEFEWKPILRHFKNKHDDLMIKFTFDTKSVLKCTMNHNVYSYNKGKVPAEELIEGDYIISEKSHKTAHILTEEAKPIILGMILGDGHLANTTASVRLQITQGQDQLEYLNYKKRILLGGFNSKNVESSSGYCPDRKVYNISSLSFKDLDNYKQSLYNNSNKKCRVPKEIATKLNKESWSLIYQDDGSLSHNCITFSFCELDKDSISNLIISLINIFNISEKDTNIFTCNRGFNYLTLNTKAAKIFLQAIAHLIHPCLEYKKGEYQYIPFTGITPINAFENFTVQKIISIDFEKPAYSNRFNIEVADNHNYIANGKLVANCHHVSAPTFSKILDKSTARYKIGLSGTIQRKDGKHIVFKDYLGTSLFQPPPENFMDPEIHVYQSNTLLPDSNMLPWAKRVNYVCYNEIYQNEVAILAAAYAARGHKVLVVSDRVELLKKCTELVGDNAICITGETEHNQREVLINKIKTGEKEILFGTQSIFCEGISLNQLSCLILASPINNEPLLTQLIGRVIRLEENKLSPVIVDINLVGRTARRQAQQRLGFYLKSGWKVSTI